MTVLAGAGSVLAYDAVADEPVDDVRSAEVGPVRPAAEPIPMDAAALEVDYDDPAWVGADVSEAPDGARFDRAAERSAIRSAIDEFAARKAEREAAAARGAMWDRLADCESGDWDANGRPIPGSHRWDYGLEFSHGDIFEGGVNFHPQTWEAYRDPGMPGHAGQATREQQIAVAERVLADQGWRAWPVCSRKLGYR